MSGSINHGENTNETSSFFTQRQIAINNRKLQQGDPKFRDINGKVINKDRIDNEVLDQTKTNEVIQNHNLGNSKHYQLECNWKLNHYDKQHDIKKIFSNTIDRFTTCNGVSLLPFNNTTLPIISHAPEIPLDDTNFK